MQLAIKTLIMFYLIMSISPTRLSTSNKGILGNFFAKVKNVFSKVSTKVLDFTSKAAYGFVSTALVGVNFSMKVTDSILTFTEAGEFFKVLIPFLWFFFPPPKITLKFFIFLPVSIVVTVIGLVQLATQELLEKIKQALVKRMGEIEAQKEYKKVEADINKAISKKTEELQKLNIK